MHLRPDRPDIDLPNVFAIDAGASGGLTEHWRRFERWLDVDAFEPNAEDCEKLARAAPPNVRYHARGLARSTGRHKLHVLNRSTGSSLYPPNERMMPRFNDRSYHGVREIVDIECVSLDDFLRERGDRSPHLLKLDTQGSELDILEGLGASRWPAVLAVEVEVEFLDLYAGQPLFPDVHRFMCERGFELFDLRTHRAYRTHNGTEDYFIRKFWNSDRARELVTAQLVAGDALYLRPIDSEQLSDRDALLRFVVVTLIYHCYELALLAVDRLETGGYADPRVLEALRRFIASLGPRPGLFDRRDALGGAARLIRRRLGRRRERRVFWTERVLPDQ